MPVPLDPAAGGVVGGSCGWAHASVARVGWQHTRTGGCPRMVLWVAPNRRARRDRAAGKICTRAAGGGMRPGASAPPRT
ncbi:MAG: hypothetical protein MI924_07220 [Chloroflexales bacterium]|nr:hypothetical protein [Chloroflexales bacterium]